MYRLLTKGGIISPNELFNISHWAQEHGIQSLLLGSRQDILIDIEAPLLKNLEATLQSKMCIIEKNSNSNISSSYVASDIFHSQSWLTSANYLYILEAIRNQPKIKVNIVDAKQNLVPLFYGDINFIASDIEEYWYLYIKDPNWKQEEYYPSLINSGDIGVYCEFIDKLWGQTQSAEELFTVISDQVDTDNRSIHEHLQAEIELFPYYEGMHRYSVDKYWLGFYRRKNLYNVQVLQSIAERCIKDRIANICITPWKSFVIKGIPAPSKLQWEYTLGSHGINVRHSQLEMNWHLPANDSDALLAKQKIVAELERRDVSTYGLTMGIYQMNRPPFTTIAIIKKYDQDSIIQSYDILQAKDFDPAQREYILYAQDVSIDAIPDLIVESCQSFFQELQSEQNNHPSPTIEIRDTKTVYIFQCTECLYIYDPKVGDSIGSISPSTPFANIPDSYICSCCGAPKSSFTRAQLELDNKPAAEIFS